MRLLFLCSCLEPAQDGVGDYTRALAAACTRLGHPSALIALQDRSIATPTESPLSTGTEKIPCLRLPAQSTWPERTKFATAFRSRFQPDWISLQFVPYGFNEKGLVYNLCQPLRDLTARIPLHLMLHELWIGQTPDAPLRQRLIGRLQRLGIKRLISALQPRRLTSSNPAYLSLLKNNGLPASLLPLFGNIPISPKTEPPAELVKTGLTQNRDSWWLAIFFGALHPEWKPEPLLGILDRAARRANKQVCLLLAGRPGPAGQTLWENLKQTYSSNFVFIQVGELPTEKISSLLQTADFGIAASPCQLVGKSGTLAAMLDHGLPVIVTRDDYRPRPLPAEPPSTDPLLHRCDDSLETKLVAGLPKREPRARLDEIAPQFCQLLYDATTLSP